MRHFTELVRFTQFINRTNTRQLTSIRPSAAVYEGQNLKPVNSELRIGDIRTAEYTSTACLHNSQGSSLQSASYGDIDFSDLRDGKF
jgi:hypothetical protein